MTMKKILAARSAALVIIALAVFMSCGIMSFADDTVTFNLRIEGINDTLFVGDVTVPAENGATTLQAALLYFDKNNDDVAITGTENAYITDINGETAGKFGGWDGWMYRVDGVEASVGIGDYKISGGESVVFYYTDEYGLGMQFPVMDTTNASSGIIKFTSADTTYDPVTYAPTTSENPVADMTVVLKNASGEETYVTDANGCIDISKTALSGAVTVQVSKSFSNGCPAVLRFAPNTTLNIVSQPATGDTAGIVYIAAAMVVALCLSAALVMKKKAD